MIRSSSHLPREDGQAMVELIIILIFIMAMCAGMIASSRLLSFQFWAQQEARYLAFEQEWYSRDFYGNATQDPIDKLDDGQFFGRPKNVSDRDATKNIADDSGGLPELLSWLGPLATEEVGREPISDLDDGPVMMARNDSLFEGKTSDWLAPGGVVDRAFALVGTAFASRDVERTVRPVGLRSDEMPQNPLHAGEGNYQDRLEPKVKNFLVRAEVGPKVCEALSGFSKRNGNPAALAPFRASDCSDRIEQGLAHNLSHNVDIKDFFRGYGEMMQNGFGAGEAIDVSVREEVASQFYSLYDLLVQTSRPLALPDLLSGRVDAAVSLADSKVTQLISDARYLGSIVAVTAITVEGLVILGQDPTTQDADAVLDFERSVNDILQTDADDSLPVGSPFFLGPQYLPVPPTFGAVAGGLQEGIMKNLLSQSEDDDLVDEQIENANKLVEVTYKAAGGLFGLATTSIRGAETAQLTGRFYLVTQPWHLTRRKDKTGDYRDKGTQDDTAGDETEEAVMRRRVLGLWLFPTDIGALLEPISLFPGLDFLGPVFDAFEPVGDVIAVIKRFVTDNPLFDIAQALSKIPVIGDIIPVPPVWPAVRPDAYPGSVEMTGNNPDEPDRLMGGTRNFSDYVKEQRDNDPEPEPDFN